MTSDPTITIVARGDARLHWQDGPPPDLADDDRAAVDEVWAQGKAKLGDNLFDGALLSYQRHTTASGVTTIDGVYHPYRYYYAQSRRTDLDCRIDPIGVSGLVVVPENGGRLIVLGRRSERVAYYPGHWECVPSGGIDNSHARPEGTVDYARMLLHEFDEEVCLPRDRVRRVTPFAVIHDSHARTYDICCSMAVETTRAELLDAMRRSDEYTETLIVPENEIADCVRRLGDDLIPLSRAIMQLFRDTNEHG